MSSRVRFGARKCNSNVIVCSPQSQRLSGTTFASNTFVINLVNKGNGDLISHDLNYQVRVVTFYNEDDEGRQMNDFWSEDILTNSFVLKNDFTDDKFSGKLVVVKEGNTGNSQSANQEYSVILNAIEDIPTPLRPDSIYFIRDDSGVSFEVVVVNNDGSGYIIYNLIDLINSKSTLQTSATFAAIGASTEKRFVQVINDERNSNQFTLYYHNGIDLNWVVTQKV